MPARLARAIAYSKLACDGGQPLGGIPRMVQCRTIQRASGENTLEVTLPTGSPAIPLLPNSAVLRLERVEATVEEWIVIRRRRRAPTGQCTLTAAPARLVLARQSLLAVNAGTDVLVDAIAYNLTATEILTTYLLPRLPSFVSLGTIEPTDRLVEWRGSALNGLQMILSLVDAINAARTSTGAPRVRFEFRRVGETGYVIDLLTSQTDEPLPLALPKNLKDFALDEDTVSQRTQYFPLGEGNITPHRATWRVAAGSGTTWDLAPWDLANGQPIGFDGQLVGDYLVKIDGSVVAITASTVANQRITIATSGGITIGDPVQLARNSGGDRKMVWTDPANPVTIAAYLPVQGVTDRVNYARNAILGDWSAGVPTGYTFSAPNGGSPTVTQNSSASFYERGPYSVKMDTVGVAFGRLEMTWPMPHLLRNRTWSAKYRVYNAGALIVGKGFYIRTTSGWTPLNLDVAPGWNWLVVTQDESAAGTGAWTAGVRFESGVAGSSLYYDRVEYALGDGTESDDIVIGCDPVRLVAAANLALAADRSETRRFEVDVIDRARLKPARYGTELILPNRRVRPIVSALAVDTTVTVVEVETDELRPASTRVTLETVAPRLTAEG